VTLLALVAYSHWLGCPTWRYTRLQGPQGEFR
jgi:hypothetical protein